MKRTLLITSLLSTISASGIAAITVPLDTTAGWDTVNGTLTHTIIADPVNPGVNVSEFAWTSGSTSSVREYTLAGGGIADGDSDSFTIQFYIPQTTGASADLWFGFTDDSTPANGWGDMEAYFGVREDHIGTGGTFDIISRDGGTGTDYDTNLAADVWHTMTLSVNNATDTYDLILNESSLASGLSFRNGTSSSLVSVALWGQQTTSGNSMLVTAVPEPSTYVLLAGFLTLGVVMVRHRLKN